MNDNNYRQPNCPPPAQDACNQQPYQQPMQQPYQQQPYQQPYQQPIQQTVRQPYQQPIQQTVIVKSESNGIGTAGFILTLCAIVLCWVPVLNVILGGLGLLLSFIGLFKAPRGLAIAGFILGLIGLFLSLVGLAALGLMV